VFANESELHALYQTADFATAVAAFQADDVLGVCTRSEKGSIVVTREGVLEAKAFPVERIADTTGAGDLFAAGFLAGLARGESHKACARLGAMAAAEIIQHVGARPEANLTDLATQAGLF